jgi:hypothetical protein
VINIWTHSGASCVKDEPSMCAPHTPLCSESKNFPTLLKEVGPHSNIILYF